MLELKLEFSDVVAGFHEIGKNMLIEPIFDILIKIGQTFDVYRWQINFRPRILNKQSENVNTQSADKSGFKRTTDEFVSVSMKIIFLSIYKFDWNAKIFYKYIWCDLITNQIFISTAQKIMNSDNEPFLAHIPIEKIHNLNTLPSLVRLNRLRD